MWIKRLRPSSADSIESLTYYLWLVASLLLDALRVYGVDVAAFCLLFSVVCLWPAARGYRRTKRVTPVFAWGAFSFALLAMAGASLWIRFHPGEL